MMPVLPPPVSSAQCRHCKKIIYQVEVKRSVRKKWSNVITEELVLTWFHTGPAPKDGHQPTPVINMDPDLDNILSGLYD